MLITCPHCKKEHQVQEEKLPSKAATARCRACGHRFQISPHQETNAPDTPSGQNGTRSISISLSKGGVGKTTTAVNLAAGLAHAGYQVLLVDTDTQGQVSYMLGVDPPAGLTEFITGELSAREATHQARERLWLLAGGRSLAGIKRLIDRKDFGGELTLQEALQKIEDQYDYVILDTSPGWDPLTVNVLFYVQEILIPVSLEVMTLQGLVEFQKSVAAIKRYRNCLSIKYILPTFLDMRVKKKTNTFLNKLQEHYPEYLCQPIRYNNILSQTPMYGKTIYEHAPGSKGAEDYKQVVRKIAGKEELFN
ncbi:MAG: AAA family ATPase [Desulfohalobiaceae bacterium]